MVAVDGRQRLSELGVWAFLDDLPFSEVVDFTTRLDELGYGALWVPETTARDPFATLAALAGKVSKLTFATGIASIFNRHPVAMQCASLTLAEITDGRFIHGIGISHAPAVEGLRGLDYSKLLTQMRNYLAAMAQAPYTAVEPAQRPPRLLAALGPKMLALAASQADGAHPYFATPEHTARARDILGPDKLLAVEQKVVLTDDRAAGRAAAAYQAERYGRLPNYRNNWKRLGFTDEQIDASHEAFLEAVVVWGDVDRIRGRIDEHLQAGADHVCIQALAPDAGRRPDMRALEALAPRAA